MISPKTKTLILSGLNHMRGDDLERATKAFSRFHPNELLFMHGESGMTRKQLLESYQRDRDEIDAAIREVKENL